MINFLLGFLTADFLFSLILYFRKDIFFNFDKKFLLFSLMIDLFLISILFLIKHAKKIR
mgnify:CR=1 FL=1